MPQTSAEAGAARQVARHHAQQHALAQAAQARLQRGLVVGLAGGELGLHRRARERRRGGTGFAGQLGMRREQPPRVARSGIFPNWIQHLRLK